LKKVPVNDNLAENKVSSEQKEKIKDIAKADLEIDTAKIFSETPIQSDEDIVMLNNTSVNYGKKNANAVQKGLNLVLLAKSNNKYASKALARDRTITFLILVLSIAVVLILLSYLIPNLLNLFIGLLILAVVIIAILYLVRLL
jgi:ABC-type multidrug transport system permease subunit